MRSVFLYPAQLAVSKEPAEIRTILGSCVAVCLFDPFNKVGGMNHYLLAKSNSEEEENLRYGRKSIVSLITEMEKAGAHPRKLQAKIYGGGAVLTGVTLGDSVGQGNVAYALAEMDKLNIPVLEENTLGNKGRKILLKTDTFEVKHEFMKGNPTDENLSGVVLHHIAKKIKILIVDDSMTVRNIFLKILSADPRIEIVGAANDPYEAREIMVKTKPDVVLLDIEMPRMSGVAFLEKMMEHMPTPTIMVSSLGSNEAAAHKCLELGATEFVHKPSQFDPSILKNLAESLISKSLAAATVPLSHLQAVRRKATLLHKNSSSKIKSMAGAFDYHSQLIAVGGNTGCQIGLTEFICSLPADSPGVVVAASSITAFITTFIEKTQKNSAIKILVAQDGAAVQQGHCYLAPAENHISVVWQGTGHYLKVSKGNPVNNQVPSANVLFKSIAATGKTKGSVAVLLSGFGTDGGDGLLQMREHGAHTIVANPESSPYAYTASNAISIGAAVEVLEPTAMAEAILRERNKVV